VEKSLEKTEKQAKVVNIIFIWRKPYHSKI
jgi:hypothetical protein